MTILKNKRHEKFAVGIFQGKTQTAAALDAGYQPKWVRSTGSTLATNPNIFNRIQELHLMAESDAVMTVRERKERLSQIGRGKITDYQTSDGILVDKNSVNPGAIEGLEIRTSLPRDSQAGNITIKRPVVPESQRNAIFERDENKCVLCSSADNLQLDHIVSLSKGGRTEDSNLQTLCEKCNKEKGAGTKSEPLVTTKLKLHNPITAIAELNKMEGEYPPPDVLKLEVEPGEKMKPYLDLLTQLRNQGDNATKQIEE